ncbi:hypothetical protein [Reinekea blandensis]|uniref:Uncharacterized protein n=1 Tax=Reinekea blandensis MED297 TaxID=314283 RepID=A4BF03_9GAMM|nr:hypothetical protein [Reinekea blandensis]EAR09338.1 hypothetical protein MED297_18658 [Reinekea sp. MED297] [Reinekea blandensis MED297]
MKFVSTGFRAYAIRVLLLTVGIILAQAAANDDQRYPAVLDVEAVEQDGRWSVTTTISSPYDSPERYADGFRVLTDTGVELEVRTLWHHHADEQPFTRSLVGLPIPDGVTSIYVQGRDKANGWGGQVVRVRLSDGATEVLESLP